MGTYRGYRGNANRVMEDAEKIVGRLEDTNTTLSQLIDEYHCAYQTMMKAVLSRISKEEYRQIAKRKLGQGSIATRFPKGHVPWTKGCKGIHLSPATEFKKGHLPQTYKPISTVYIINDKRGIPYRWIKSSDEGRRQDRRKPYARYVWEQENGPIPPGGMIRHKDGDTLNDDPNNLVLVDCATNGALNQAMPGVRAKMRRNCAKASKRRWRIYRKEKKRREAELAKLEKERLKAAAEDAQHKAIYKQNIVKFRGPVHIWYDCRGCGFDTTEPKPPCPKCGHLAFERIEQSVEFNCKEAIG